MAGIKAAAIADPQTQDLLDQPQVCMASSAGHAHLLAALREMYQDKVSMCFSSPNILEKAE